MVTDNTLRNTGTIMLVANYESNVGYAWWLMENFWATIARHFIAQGRRCVLIYPKVNEVPRVVREAGIAIIEHDFDDRSFTALRRLRKIIADEDVSSLYLTDKPYYSVYYAVLRLFGIRRIVMHDHKPGERPRVTGWRRQTKSLVLRMRPFTCDYYVGVSRFVRERLIANTCVPEDRCGYVLNGIQPVAKTPDARVYVRREFNLPANAVIAVSTGRATFYKGVDFILRCAQRIVDDDARADVYFLHCGDGPDLPRFQQMLRDYRLDGRFIFAGRRTDVRRILPGCDIAIQASRGEAFSLSILEYLSAGLPTLAPDHCGNGEAVTSGVDGFLFRPDDLDGALAKLRTLLDNPALRQQFGAAGAASVERGFTLARANRDLIDLLAARL